MRVLAQRVPPPEPRWSFGACTDIARAVSPFEGQGSPFSPVGRLKSTVRKPSALSAKLANDFENGCVHSPVRPKGNGGTL